MPNPSTVNGFTGVVQSGTGATYQVLLNTGQTVTVTILQIDPGETIPSGTPLIVVLNETNGAYYSQVAVWTA